MYPCIGITISLIGWCVCVKNILQFLRVAMETSMLYKQQVQMCLYLLLLLLFMSARHGPGALGHVSVARILIESPQQ